ncbi:MAG: O-antigen ligase family protein [Bacteroidota bacterium]
MNEVITSRKNLIILSAAGALAAAVVNPLISLAVLSFILLLSYSFKYNTNAVVFSVIAAYLLITDSLGETVRNAVNLAGLLILAGMFLKEYSFQPNRFPRISGRIAAFAAMAILSMLLSSYFSEAPLKTFIVTFRQVIFFVICYLIYSFTRDLKSVHYNIAALQLVALVLGIAMSYELIKQGYAVFLIQSNSFVRLSGLYNNPNSIGLVYTVSMPLFLPFVRKYKNKSMRIFTRLMLLFFAAILLLTNSRASMIAVIIASGYYLYVTNRRLFGRISLIAAGIMFVLFFVPPFSDYMMLFMRVDRIFATTRNSFWEVAISIIKANPLLGVGPEMFPDNIFRYLPVPLDSFDAHQMWNARTGTAHNFYLFRLAELGIPGLAAGLYLIYLFFSYSSRALRENRNAEHFRTVLSFRCAGLGIVARSFLESNGILTHGWLTRDLPFWLVFISLVAFYDNIIRKKQDISYEPK